jgi:hypothetical protein
VKKRLLAILLTICMVAALLPTAVFADDADVTTVSTEEQLRAAIAVGGSIKLEDDITVNTTINVANPVTLDLNGKTITNNVENARMLTITASSFTVNANGGSMVIPDTNALSKGFSNVTADSTFTLNGGTYTGDTDNGRLFNVSDDASTVTVNLNQVKASTNLRILYTCTKQKTTVNVTGGSYTSTDSETHYDVFFLDSDLDDSPNEATFDGVTVTSYNRACIEVATGKATFKDCHFTVNGPTENDDQAWRATAVSVSYGGTATIQSGTYTGSGFGAYVYSSGGTINIEGGTVSGDIGAAYADVDSNTHETAVATVNISGGKINGELGTNGNAKATISVSGGYYTVDPDAITDPSITVASGKTVVSSDEVGYAYQVVDASTVDTVVKPLVVETATADVNKIDEEDQKAVEDAIKTISIPDVTSTDTANAVTEQINPSVLEAAVAAAQTALDTEDDIIVYTQISLDVEAEAYDDEAGELTLDITPKATLIASTAKTADQIKLKGDSGTKNAIEYGTVPVDITEPVEISITLPKGFKDAKYIEHTKNGATYVYTGTVSEENVLTFKNPHGFSKFKITKNGPVATIQGAGFGYTSLSDAFAKIKNGDTITVADGTTENIYVGNTVTFTIKGDYKGQVLASNIYTTITTKDVTGGTEYTCVYTAPSVPVYRVVVNDAEGGKIKASANKAAEGATIVLTPVADDEEGELETLAVVDEDGNAVTLTKRANGTYSFVMPAKAVTVTGTFTVVADPEEPDEDEEPGDEEEESTVFTDVDEDAYYAEAVAWAVANEITKGTSETTFSPDDDCTRAQVVTFLWRYAGKPEPTTTENPFTDVEEGTDYYKAILWAYENGITTGTSDTTFSPDETCTRAQVVTFLWRYEGELTYEEAETFTDVAEDAYYAKAVAWAVHEWITKGTGDGQFSPDETCTRGQVVTFLYRDTAEG